MRTRLLHRLILTPLPSLCLLKGLRAAPLALKSKQAIAFE